MIENGETIKKSKTALREEEILEFWRTNSIFQKTLDKPAPNGNFVFFDGPPFANGLPHYGHILAGTMKDVIPRYQTMRGKYVRRRWGWDTHGLPVENLAEKELGLKSKKDIVEYGMEKFNAVASESVLRYVDEWKAIIPRLGRFVDMDNSYKTLDQSYTESVWWAFKTLHEKNHLEEAFKIMYYCPHCETTLANFEVNQGYTDFTDISVTVKFELIDEPGTFLLAWTTTPWTLPGNVALAVNPDVLYVKILHEGNSYIVARDRAAAVFNLEGDEWLENSEKIKGSDLIGTSYKPVFDYYQNDEKIKNKENGWKVYGADFVTTEDGTGIVHIAPAFGSDDYELLRKENLPFIQHVASNGTFNKEVTDFVGLPVKPKVNHQSVDIEIIKYLAHHGTLFAKKKITHQYPVCWRCDTPLLNYAARSWFVKVSQMKEKLVALNKNISWVPSDIREGRFGKWLEGARDWGISRSRFWGAPLPVWKCEKDETHSIKVIGSIEELQKESEAPIATFFLMRHGESEKNIEDVYDNTVDRFGLTKKGQKEVLEAIESLKEKGGIDVIYASPVLRTKETAEIIAKSFGLNITYASELIEVDSGEWNGVAVTDKSIKKERDAYFALPPEEYFQTIRGVTGESWEQVEKRVVPFLKDAVNKHPGKKILFVTHGGVVQYALKYIQNLSTQDAVNVSYRDEFQKYASPIQLHTQRESLKEFNLHRPFIDEVTLTCECGGEMKRIEDVFDCWFESGSMPYASVHYPFENKELFEQENSPLFPADFIAEGIDQTRGWFYTMLVLGTALFDRSPYKNVIVNGIINAEDGQKMAKRLKNYPDPLDIVSQYGADALRFYLIASPAVKAENINFSEKGVDEISKKVVSRLQNVVSFYEMYKKSNISPSSESKHVLDQWIISRLHQVVSEVTYALDAYELDRAARPFVQFIDDLSTWYIRRSRDRFRDGDVGALQTTQYVLIELSKILAPFMPFSAEDIYQTISDEKTEPTNISVHLEDWPEIQPSDGTLITQMEETREIVSLALEARSKVNIKVRQPLRELQINSGISEIPELCTQIADEVNVKEVVSNSNLKEKISLDTTITPELQLEGSMRELIRAIQDMRKKADLNPSDDISVSISTDEVGKSFIERFKKEISKPTNIKTVSFAETEGETIIINEFSFVISIT